MSSGHPTIRCCICELALDLLKQSMRGIMSCCWYLTSYLCTGVLAQSFLFSGSRSPMTNVSDLIRSIEHVKEEVPRLRTGDTVRVHTRIVEGDRERLQVFQGIVIRQQGSGAARTFTVRRVASHGIGVERTFPLHSPRVEKIEVVSRAQVRRAKLYFLRGRRGKSARLKEERERA